MKSRVNRKQLYIYYFDIFRDIKVVRNNSTWITYIRSNSEIWFSILASCIRWKKCVRDHWLILSSNEAALRVVVETSVGIRQGNMADPAI